MASPVDRDRWRRLAPYLDAALDLPPERRPGWLESLRRQDDDLAAELAQLLQAHQVVNEAGFLQGQAADLPAPPTTGGRAASPQRGLYVLGAEIGRGGMGRVIAAQDDRAGRIVAIKEMLSDDPAALARFERESRITARLQHPGIVSVYEVGRWDDGRPFYAMPILPGRTLLDAIGAAPSLHDRLRLVPAVIAAADAVAYAHSRRIIHRDLKPANILLGSFGETIVIDWGVAKELDDDDAPERAAAGAPGDALTRSGTVMGTPAYMPPEQARGEPVDERADVHALGAILLHVLSGAPPGRDAETKSLPHRPWHRTPPALPRGVAPDLQAIVRRAMSPDASARYATARDLADDLRRLQAGDRVRTHRYSVAQLLTRWLAPRVRLVTYASVVLGALTVAAISGGLRASQQSRRAQETARTLMAEQGRQEWLAGNPTRALAYLSEAYRRGDRRPSLRFILRQAASAVEAREQRFEIPDYPYGLTFGPDGRSLAVAARTKLWIWKLTADGQPLPDPVHLENPTSAGRLAFSRDGSRLYAWGDAVEHLRPRIWEAPLPRRLGLDAFGATVWSVDRQTLIASLGIMAPVNELQFDDRDTQLLTVGHDPEATGLWDPVTGAARPISSVLTENRTAHHMRMSADGKHVATIDGRGTLRIRESSSGRLVSSLETGDTQVRHIELTGDGSRLVTISPGGVRVWHLSGAAGPIVIDRSAWIDRVYLSPDDRRMLLVDRRWEGALFDLEGRQLVGGRPMTSFAFSRDSTRLATAEPGPKIRVWSLLTGRQLDVFDTDTDAVSLAFSPDGSRLAAGLILPSDNLRMFKVDRRLLAAHAAPAANALAGLTPDGRLLTLDSAGRLRAADAVTGVAAPLAPVLGQGPPVALSGDRRWALVATATPGELEVLSTHSGRRRASLRLGSDGRHAQMSFDGARIVATDAAGETTLWDGRTGKRVLAVAGYRPEDRATELSPDGRWLALCDAGEFQWKLWDATGARRWLLERGKVTVSEPPPSAAFSPDSTRLLTWTMGSRSDRPRLWSLDNPGRHEELSIPAGTVLPSRFLFSPDAQHIAVSDAGVKVWSIPRRTIVSSITEQVATSVSSLGERGDILVVAGEETLTLWDWREQTVLAVLEGVGWPQRGDPALKRHVEATPDGRLLAVSRPGGGVLVWRTELETRNAEEIQRIADAQDITWRPGGDVLVSARPKR
jgi:eukaryotic-like serine/threonine-protein kinase